MGMSMMTDNDVTEMVVNNDNDDIDDNYDYIIMKVMVMILTKAVYDTW